MLAASKAFKACFKKLIDNFLKNKLFQESQLLLWLCSSVVLNDERQQSKVWTCVFTLPSRKARKRSVCRGNRYRVNRVMAMQEDSAWNTSRQEDRQLTPNGMTQEQRAANWTNTARRVQINKIRLFHEYTDSPVPEKMF